MLTFLAVLLLILMLAGIACLVNAMINGCPFAWAWYLFGGLQSSVEVVGLLLTAIIGSSSD
jgi:hypothetical protein